MKLIKLKVADAEMSPQEIEKKKSYVQKAIKSAESVLSIFEKEVPADKRPRQAIEAAKNWVKDPSERNSRTANGAFYRAWAASLLLSGKPAAAGKSAAYCAAVAAGDNAYAYSSNTEETASEARKAK